jgi:hypothetical protein
VLWQGQANEVQLAMRRIPPPSSSVVTSRPRRPGTWDLSAARAEPRFDGAEMPKSSAPPALALTSAVTSQTEVSATGTAIVCRASRRLDQAASLVKLVQDGAAPVGPGGRAVVAGEPSSTG